MSMSLPKPKPMFGFGFENERVTSEMVRIFMLWYDDNSLEKLTVV